MRHRMILASMLSAMGMLSTGKEPDLDPEPSEPPPPDPDDRAFDVLKGRFESLMAERAVPQPGTLDAMFHDAHAEVMATQRMPVLDFENRMVRGVEIGDRPLVKPAMDPVRYLELWIDEHGGASEEVLRKVLDDAYGEKACGVVEIGEHLPTRITGVLRETHDTPDSLTLPDSSAHLATVRATGANPYRLHSDFFKQVQTDVHQGNPFGKTTADLRRLTDGFTALGNAAAGASRIADDIPLRAAEPYKPALPVRKAPYIPFYTPAELAERRTQAKAKKAKRKSAQASKRRNRS